MSDIDQLLQQLDKVTKSGSGWVARCPAHEDTSPSLSINEGCDGKLLLKCHAGCTFEEILASVTLDKPVADNGVTLDNFSEYLGIDRHLLFKWGITESGHDRLCIPFYDVKVSLGKESLLVVRRTKFRLSLHGKSGKPKYAWGKGKDAHPYGLWQPVTWDQGLVLAEGETDAMALWSAGVPALGIPGASMVSKMVSKWIDHLPAKVWVAVDQDDVGSGFLRDAQATLGDKFRGALAPPEPYKDICAWMKGVGLEKFKVDVREALKVAHKVDTAFTPAHRVWTLKELMATEIEAPRLIIPGVLPSGVTILVGSPKAGKSMLAANLAYAHSLGSKALGSLQAEKGKVLYLDLEPSEYVAKDRWDTIMGDDPQPNDDIEICFEWDRMDEGGLAQLEAHLRHDADISLVVIDLLSLFWPVDKNAYGGENAYHRETKIMQEFTRVSRIYDAAIILVHHTKKMNMGLEMDPLNQISGTNAMGGKADTVWFLWRQRDMQDGRLLVTGKSIEERWLDLQFRPGRGGWALPPNPMMVMA